MNVESFLIWLGWVVVVWVVVAVGLWILYINKNRKIRNFFIIMVSTTMVGLCVCGVFVIFDLLFTGNISPEYLKLGLFIGSAFPIGGIISFIIERPKVEEAP